MNRSHNPFLGGEGEDLPAAHDDSVDIEHDAEGRRRLGTGGQEASRHPPAASILRQQRSLAFTNVI